MKRVKWGNIFALEIPDSWVFREEEDVIALHDAPNAVGAMHISLARRQLPQEPTIQEVENFAMDYASQRGWDASEKSIRSWNMAITHTPVSEISAQDRVDGQLIFWRVWHILGRERLAFITYNCLETDKETEAKLCDRLISSLQWL